METSGPGEATTLASDTTNDYDVVVAVGGDGTVHEVANGLIGTGKALGIIPIGSGNDFAKMLNLSKNLKDSIETLLKNKIHEIDVGKVVCSPSLELKSSQQIIERYFVNGVGIGFDAQVAHESASLRWITGLPLYTFSLFRALITYQSPLFNLSIDHHKLYKKLFLVAIGNGTCVGGGFYLTPKAKIDDGYLDICVVEDVSIRRVLQVFPSVLKGDHGKYPEVGFFRGKKILIETENPTAVHADGEILGTRITNINIEIIPRKLKVLSN